MTEKRETHEARTLSMADGKGNYSIAICQCGYSSNKQRGYNDAAKARRAADKHAR